jgi:transcriptional regulator with XRE-family HTH domain
MIDRAFATVLRRLRKEAGLTQEQLGEQSDLDRTYISELERCLKTPSLLTLWKLCKALDVRFQDMAAQIETEVLTEQPR